MYIYIYISSITKISLNSFNDKTYLLKGKAASFVYAKM